MNKNKLSADSSAMTLGIIALVIVVLGCCCGFFSIIAVALSIIGLVSANKSLRAYNENPDVYAIQSYKNVSTAKILNLIALILSSIITLVYLAYFVIYGALMSSAFMDAYKQNNSDFEWENDSLYYEEEIYKTERDSIVLDSISIEEILKIDNSENSK